MSGNYDYYYNTLNEITGKIKIATEAFSRKNGNYCAIPQYIKEKKVLIVRVKNLSDGSSFAIFQKLGKSFGVKCYDCKNKELYEYIQSINGDTKSSYLYYDYKRKIGIQEISSKNSIDNAFYPTKIEENIDSQNSEIINFTNTIMPSDNGPIYYKTLTNLSDTRFWTPEEQLEKSMELIHFYYLLNSNSVKESILEFNKTFKKFILNNSHILSTSDKDSNKKHPEDR